MSRKGLQYVCVGKRTVAEGTGAVTYTDGKYLGPSSTMTGTTNKTDSRDYGDSALQERDDTVTSVTLSWEINSDNDDLYEYLLGHTKDAESSEITFSALDEAPHVGVAVVGQEGSGFIGIFYDNVVWSEPDDSWTTKRESTEFGHITLSGEVFLDDLGNYKVRKRFTTKAEALEWAKTKCGIAAAAA